jgi:diacylglycerol kinase (ATP)
MREGEGMSGRHILVIFNPAAGGSRKRALLDRFAAAAEARGCRVELRATLGGGTGGDDLDLSGQGDLIVAAGGDGTLHQVANVLHRRGDRRPVAFFPLGTANVFAYEARLPRRAEALAAALIDTPPVDFRLGWGQFTGFDGAPEERVFLLMAGVGFDARVSLEVDPRVKKFLGKGAYAASALRRLFAGRRERFILSADGRETEGEWAVAANIPWYGGPFIMAPRADHRRSALAVAHVGRITPALLARLLFSAARGRQESSGGLVYLEADRVEVATPGIPIQMDGDPVGWTPAVFTKTSWTLPVIMAGGHGTP